MSLENNLRSCLRTKAMFPNRFLWADKDGRLRRDGFPDFTQMCDDLGIPTQGDITLSNNRR